MTLVVGAARPLRRVAVAIAVTGAGLTGLAACGGGSSAAGDATMLQVNLGRFVIEPAVLEAPPGDVELQVTNVDPEMVHDLVVYGKGTRRLAPGQSQTLRIPAIETGEYLMWCDVPGHAAAGQKGTLAITPAAAQPAAG